VLRPAFAVAACSLLLLTAVSAQAPAQFEVASVKPVKPGDGQIMGTKVYPGGRVTLSGLPLKTLIAIAFQVSYWQISGGEAWTATDFYNVEALPGGVVKDLRYTLFGIEDARLREMLQSLLIDRFQLKLSRTSKPGDVYTLERGEKTIKLRPVDGGPASFGNIGYVEGRWSFQSMSMAQLAKFASDWALHAPVADGTGLNGLFDYRQIEPDPEPNYGDNPESFLQLIREVGLKIKRSKGTVETLVIDQAERPSSN
jgi:uncharacterized protein (TIGR03435 family)